MRWVVFGLLLLPAAITALCFLASAKDLRYMCRCWSYQARWAWPVFVALVLVPVVLALGAAAAVGCFVEDGARTGSGIALSAAAYGLLTALAAELISLRRGLDALSASTRVKLGAFGTIALFGALCFLIPALTDFLGSIARYVVWAYVGVTTAIFLLALYTGQHRSRDGADVGSLIIGLSLGLIPLLVVSCILDLDNFLGYFGTLFLVPLGAMCGFTVRDREVDKRLWIMFAFFGLPSLILWPISIYENYRSALVREFAEQRGWAYHKRDDIDFKEQLDFLEPKRWYSLTDMFISNARDIVVVPGGEPQAYFASVIHGSYDYDPETGDDQLVESHGGDAVILIGDPPWNPGYAVRVAPKQWTSGAFIMVDIVPTVGNEEFQEAFIVQAKTDFDDTLLFDERLQKLLLDNRERLGHAFVHIDRRAIVIDRMDRMDYDQDAEGLLGVAREIWQVVFEPVRTDGRPVGGVTESQPETVPTGSDWP